MAQKVSVSFEFFPPGDEAAVRQWWDAVRRLAPLQPEFVSVTHGADGSTRSRTLDCVLRLLRETDLRVAPHLTGVGATRADIQAMARTYWSHGIRNLVVLRGDRAATAAGAPAGPDAFPHASDLVRELHATADFDLSVAAYPEGHPESPGIEADIENVKRKVDAGASRAITQFFFDTEAYLRYRDRCRRAGVTIPIVPGILPITRFAQLVRFAGRCGTKVPDWLVQRFEGLDDDVETRRLIAAHLAIEQVQRLQAEGVDAFHFYTLNRAELTYAICRALGLRAAQELSPAEVA